MKSLTNIVNHFSSLTLHYKLLKVMKNVILHSENCNSFYPFGSDSCFCETKNKMIACV
uniref:Uncharacterized protein n=1 Tax=Anguilla anguilla TaxID=7936 RepID=A0A0E9VL74_ANGAN